MENVWSDENIMRCAENEFSFWRTLDMFLICDKFVWVHDYVSF